MEFSTTATTREPREGRTAQVLERQAEKLPADAFLWAAGASIGTSMLLRLSGRREDALFVGQWAPTFLLLGIYGKVMKMARSESIGERRFH